MAKAKQQSPTYDAAYYEKNMPSQIADMQSQQLGISKDQLYKMYGAWAQANPNQPTQFAWGSQFSFAPTSVSPASNPHPIANIMG